MSNKDLDFQLRKSYCNLHLEIIARFRRHANQLTIKYLNEEKKKCKKRNAILYGHMRVFKKILYPYQKEQKTKKIV